MFLMFITYFTRLSFKFYFFFSQTISNSCFHMCLGDVEKKCETWAHPSRCYRFGCSHARSRIPGRKLPLCQHESLAFLWDPCGLHSFYMFLERWQMRPWIVLSLFRLVIMNLGVWPYTTLTRYVAWCLFFYWRTQGLAEITLFPSDIFISQWKARN